MKKTIPISLFIVSIISSVLIVNSCNSPTSIPESPIQVNISLFVPKSRLIKHKVGDTLQIGIKYSTNDTIDSISLQFDEDTTIVISEHSNSTNNVSDSLFWLEHVFFKPGQKILIASIFSKDSSDTVQDSVYIYGIPAKITGHPDSITINEYDTVEFSVSAIGTDPIKYQWYKNSNEIQGFTDSILLIPSCRISDTGLYQCVVSNEWGNPDTSENCLLAINQKPVFSDTIVNTSYTIGEYIVFDISASDIDRDSLVLNLLSGPTNASFKDSGNGTGTFNWQTGITDSGTHTILFTVSDGNLVDTQRVIIRIEGFYTYAVTYDGNGNTDGTVPSPQTKTFGAPLTLSSNSGNLVKTGYTFMGWSTSAEGDGPDYSEGASYTTDAVLTLYAKWAINTYTVTYNGNGNTEGTVPQSQTKTHGVALTLAQNTGGLVKTGYTFERWNTVTDGSGTDYAEEASYTMDSSVILFAQWKPLPPKIESQLKDTTVNTGNDVAFSVNVSGGNLTYQWQRNGNTITGADSSILLIDTVTRDDSSANFRCIVSNALGSDTSKTAILHVVSVASVSTGQFHTMIIMTDGTLWATGQNNDGQLGDGTITDKHTPVNIESGVSSVSAGYAHTMIIKTDSTLWATGQNYNGQLGDGTTSNKHTPVNVLSGVSSVSAGYRLTMILKKDNTLWATGFNNNGQLGDGTTTDKYVPVNVLSGVSSVSAGYTHTMIIKTDNTLWATGFNNNGQLGDGTTTDKHTPLKVLSDVSSVSTGSYHTMIIKADSTLWATGFNLNGQFGDGTTTNKNTPVNVMSGISSVSAGALYTMVIKTDGTLWATGWNEYYQLGDGTTTDKATPVNVLSDVSSVSAGYAHTMVIKTDGTLWGTGLNNNGQLGDGTTDSKSTPVLIRF